MYQRIKNLYHMMIVVLANMIYRFPARRLSVIGVTGTDGKTTTVNLIYHLLKTAGLQVSMISTVGAVIAGENYDVGFHVTTPRRFHLQKLLRDALTDGFNGPKYMVLEVSSHSIDQNQLWGIPFVFGVLTNVTHEHLDYHKTYDNYLKTKVKLLRKARIAVLNKDDYSYREVMDLLPRNKPVLTYAIKNSKSNVNPKTFVYKNPFPGIYNHLNMLAAVTVARSLGIDDEVIRKGLSSFTLPRGRMEFVYDKAFGVVIDYAHTPNGLEQALGGLRELKYRKIIAIIGAEGLRDKQKRPMLGQAAVRLADYVIITAVDPRGQLDEINNQILEGCIQSGGVKDKNVFVVDDRQKAIDFAIQKLAKRGDVVGVFGKAHEKSMNLDGRKELPWSDYKAVEKALDKKSKS